MNQLAILLRRELWENRAITAVPAVIGGLLLLVAILSVVGVASIHVGDMPFDVMEAARRLDAESAGPLLQIGFMTIGVTFNTVMIFVIAFYLLDSLYADRKDRSVLRRSRALRARLFDRRPGKFVGALSDDMGLAAGGRR